PRSRGADARGRRGPKSEVRGPIIPNPMSDTRQQLAEHLRFYSDLGVDGVSGDPRWSRRADSTDPDPRTSDLGSQTSDLCPRTSGTSPEGPQSLWAMSESRSGTVPAARFTRSGGRRSSSASATPTPT